MKVLLFDLDGTLLPMDQDAFTNGYFSLIAKKLAPFGYEANALVKGIWAGTKAMVMNDGTRKNEDAFWEVFNQMYPETAERDRPLFDEFYENEFDGAIQFCSPSKEVPAFIASLKEKGYRMVLATNPIFPSVATMKRTKWAGLNPEDFEIITTYENTNFCKPNPAYYMDLAKRLGVSPEDCIMIGNDVEEDLIAEKTGMKVFLLEDCMLNKKELDITKYPKGSFDACLKFIEEC